MMAGLAEPVSSRSQARRSGRAVKLQLEILPDRILPAVNVFTWDPPNPNQNDLATTAANWQLSINGVVQKNNNSIPGQQATDQVVFDGSTSNAPIIWGPGQTTFASMSLGVFGNQPYTGQQTIAQGATVEMTGANGTSLTMPVTGSILDLDFGDGGKFNLDANATITNMYLGGFVTGQLTIGGVTQIGTAANYNDYIGAQIQINTGATLFDDAYSPLHFNANKVSIVDQGTMSVLWDQNANTLIDQTTPTSGCYLNVNGGTLNYIGSSGVTNTFKVPVLVQNGGTFSVAGGLNAGSTLIVSGAVLGTTNNTSVYMKDINSSVQLSQNATLECDNDYSQADGTLETMDATPCTLQDGQTGAGTVNIAGGSVTICQPGGFGVLNVNCNTLNFDGRYNPLIAGAGGNQDVLNVSGTVNLLAGSNLNITVAGQLAQNQDWVILASPNKLQNGFAQNNEQAVGLKGETLNQPETGDYELNS
jgi:hypothetical protein